MSFVNTNSPFDEFNAYPVTEGSALNLNWSFEASFNTDVSNEDLSPDFLYIYVTDASSIAAGKTISSTIVVPLYKQTTDQTTGVTTNDEPLKLTTSFEINNDTPGMQFILENGTAYQCMGQIRYTDTNNNNKFYSKNSIQSIVMCSTIPQVPVNFVLTPYNQRFGVKLLTNETNPTTPEPISEFDGYGVLKAMYITYSNGNILETILKENDSSNNLYYKEQFIDVSFGSYEVAISIDNYNKTTTNGTKIIWGGESAITSSKVIEVDEKPGAPTDLDVYETMADASAVNQPSYTTVSNKISWAVPNTGASAETITSYNIYRDDVSIKNVSATTFSYIDNDNALLVGEEYSYTVAAVNSEGEGQKATAVLMTGVVFPIQTLLTVDASGSNKISIDVSYNYNGFPLDNYRFDFSYNSESDASGNTGYQSNNPYELDASNGIKYTIQSRLDVSSVNMSGVSYTTSYFTPPVTFVPYDPVITDPSNIEVTPLDASGEAPTGNVTVSWVNSDLSGAFDGEFEYVLEYKLYSDPSSNYSVVSNEDAVVDASSSFTMTTGLTLGKSYIFRVKNTLTGTAAKDTAGRYAESDYIVSDQVVPFEAPSAVQNLTLSNATTTDMSYAFEAPANSGGLPIDRYSFKLRNLNDGSDNLVYDISSNDMSGNLATLFQQSLDSGTQYKLIVSAIVDGSYNVPNDSFNGEEASAIEFTVPTGLDDPSVNNVENGELLEGIKISWDISGTTIDASNVTYTIYADGAGQPIVTGLTDTSYVDMLTSAGSVNSFQVLPVVNGVMAPYVPNVTPNPSVDIRTIKYPAQPTDLTITGRLKDEVDFSWNESVGGSGNDASLNYLWMLTDGSGNVDASGETVDLDASASSLDAAQTYTLTVQAGVVNPEDGLKYYNSVNIPELDFRLYDSIPDGSINYIYSSSGALLINLVDAVDVSGVSFVKYKIDVADDASFNTIVKEYNGSASEFYASGLTNGTTYYIRAYNVYNDGTSNIVSDASPTTTGVPRTSPNQPTGVVADTESVTSITVYWDIPPSTDPNRANVYALNYGTDPNNLIPTTMTFEDLSDFSYNATQYYREIPGLDYGKKYYANVVAGIDLSGSYAVSQPSTTVEAVPYTTPSVPRNFQNYPSTQSIQSEWTQPSNTGGAGQGLNSQLFYRVQLATDTSFATIVTDASGLTDVNYDFTDLTVNTEYNARVRAYFFVQGDTADVAVGSWETQEGILTQLAPIEPTINVTAQNSLDNGSQKGRTVLIDYKIDPSFAATLTLKRQAYDPTGTTALDASYILIVDSSNVPIGTSSGQFVDDENILNFNDSSANFLNGNMMQYQLDVSYDITGGSDPLHTVTNAASKVAPYGKPIPFDASGVEIDLSDCIVPIDTSNGEYNSFTLRINKNGSNINSLVAVGLLNVSGSVYVFDASAGYLNNITYDNVQVDGKIAANQYGTTIVNYGNDNLVDNTLAIISNSAGAQICKQPEGGSFGNN